MVYSRWPAFTETRLRPLARRRDSTARPLLVFIRDRKPCVFERRRRLGWNVRFGIENGAPYRHKIELSKPKVYRPARRTRNLLTDQVRRRAAILFSTCIQPAEPANCTYQTE